MLLNQNKGTDSNAIIGIIVIFVLLFSYTLFTGPSQEQMEAMKRHRDSLALEEQVRRGDTIPIQDKQTQVEASNENSAKIDSAAVSEIAADAEKEVDEGPFKTHHEEARFITIENEKFKIALSTKGGIIHSVQLKDYHTYDTLPLFLFTPDTSFYSINFIAGNRSYSTKDLVFEPSGRSLTLRGEESKTISMRCNADGGGYIEYVYTLTGNSYLLGFEININGMNDIIADNVNYLVFDWQALLPRQEKSLKNERINTTVYFKYLKDEVDYLSETADERKTLQTKLNWVAFKQQFFSSFLIAEDGFDKPGYLETISDEHNDSNVKKMTASLTLPYDHNKAESFKMKFYFGPNHYSTLKEYDLEMEAIIPLGWGIFGWVNRFLVIPVFNFFEQYIPSYGIIILILTVVIKVILFPLMYKSYVSSAKMRVLKPEVDAIGAKFPKQEDAMKKQQAVMGLYKKAGVNPLGGCLPMLVQFPILIAMYRFFPASIELRQEPFLWADDLSSYDSILDLSFTIPFYGDHVSLFTLLMTISTLVSIKLNAEMAGGTQMQMPQMKIMMYLMPVMFLGFFNDFASALSYYYFIANMITLGQQQLMKMFIDEDELMRKIEEFKKRPAAPKSKFQLKLEKMAKQRGYK